MIEIRKFQQTQLCHTFKGTDGMEIYVQQSVYFL